MSNVPPHETAAIIRAHTTHARTHLAEVQRALDAITEATAYVAPLDAPVKACGCGRSYSREQWGALDYAGTQDDGSEVVELRNCTCGSTLGVVVGPSPTR